LDRSSGVRCEPGFTVTDVMVPGTHLGRSHICAARRHRHGTTSRYHVRYRRFVTPQHRTLVTPATHNSGECTHRCRQPLGAILPARGGLVVGVGNPHHLAHLHTRRMTIGPTWQHDTTARHVAPAAPCHRRPLVPSWRTVGGAVASGQLRGHTQRQSSCIDAVQRAAPHSSNGSGPRARPPTQSQVHH
jgi:hypothetical protein